MAGLSGGMIDAITFIEQCFWEGAGIPTNEKIADATGSTVKTIMRYWQDEQFRLSLATKGITFDGRMDKKVLTPQQMVVANMIMSTVDRRSLREKIKSLPEDWHVTPQAVSAWMRQPAFQEHLRRRAQHLFDDIDTSAYMGLVKAVEAGDMKAIQLALEIKGIYNPRVDVKVNIDVVLSRVIEIITTHVKDPAIITAIATDIERVVSPSNALPASSA